MYLDLGWCLENDGKEKENPEQSRRDERQIACVCGKLEDVELSRRQETTPS